MILILLGSFLCFTVLYLVAFTGAIFRPPFLTLSTWERITKILSILAISYLGLWLTLVSVHLLAPQPTGSLALTQVLAPLILLPALMFTPLVVARGTKWFRWMLLITIVVFLLRYPPALPFGRATVTTTTQVRVMNWNVTISPERNQLLRLKPLLRTKPADVIVLQEAYWEWLRTDSTITKLYPYQLMHTEQASSGLVLLSSYPVLAHGTPPHSSNTRGLPRLIWARLNLGQGHTLLVVAAHPESPYTSNRSDCRFPACYDTQARDSLTPVIRAVLDPALANNEPVLLIGDLNITDREPQYTDLSRGLQDSHDQAGRGWGLTFGLFHTESSDNINGNFLLPLLRFDYIFSSPNLVPIRSSVDCSLRGSEHCIVFGTFAVQ